MILVDTSVWIEFLPAGERVRMLGELVKSEEVLGHPWIFGEMMAGAAQRRPKPILPKLFES